MSAIDRYYASGGLPIDPRNRFQPPRYPLHRLPSDTAREWKNIPHLPLFTDMHGEQIPASKMRIQFAWDDTALHLRATIRDGAPLLRADQAEDSAYFFTQDSIDLRFTPDPLRPLEQAVLIFAPDGRFYRSGEIRDGGAGVRVTARHDAKGWALTARVPYSALPIARPTAGAVLRGQLTYTRWFDRDPRVLAISPTETSFSQSQRHAEFVLTDDAPPVLLDAVDFGPAPRDDHERRGGRPLRSGANPARLTLVNTSPDPLTVRLLIEQQAGEREAGNAHARTLTLTPGRNVVRHAFDLERPLFRRFRISVQRDGRTQELAALSLRAATAVVDPAKLDLQHPYLCFDERMLAELQRKSVNPAFAWMVDRLSFDPDQDLTGRGLPSDPENPPALEFTRRRDRVVGSKVGLGMIVRAMTRHGTRPAQRVWGLLPDAARTEMERAADGHEPDPDAVVAGLNSLLARRDLYQSEDWTDTQLPPDAVELIERGVGSLGEADLARLNRMLVGTALHHGLGVANIHLAHEPYRCLCHWVLSRDERLIALATKYVRAAGELLTLPWGTDLHEGGISSGLALAYDTFHPYLSEDDREAWRDLLGRYLQLHLNTARARHWNTTNNANANPVCNGGGGLLALALLKEHPDAPESLYLARKLIRNHLDYCYGHDGGNTEGTQYWEYGMSNFLRFACALERTLGTDDALLAHPAIANGPNFLRVAISNDGKVHGVNDTIPMPIDVSLAAFFAHRHDDPLALWWTDKAPRVYQEMAGRGCKVVGGGDPLTMMVHRPNVPLQTDQPPLPTAMVLEDIQYSVMRSGTNWDCTLVAGLKGSRPPYTHHNQPDSGAYYIDLRGEKMLLDPGYYKGEPSMHCLPLIGGTGPMPPADFTAIVHECVSEGALRYLACDSTRAYNGNARRVVRHLVMLGEEGLVLLDDIVPTRSGALVTAQYQTGGPTEDVASGRGVITRGERAAMRCDVLTRPGLALTRHEERTFHDSHWGYHFAECRWFPVTGEYTPDEMDPLVTVFLDATERDPGAAIARSDPNRLTVTLPSGAKAVFAYFDGRWQLDVSASSK